MPDKPKLIIFDWDGTLCDSQARIVGCMQRAAQAVGHEVLSVEQIKNVIGLGLPESMLRLYPMLSQQAREELKQQYIDDFLAADSTPSPLFDGAFETLVQLKTMGYSLAVATGKSRRGLNRVLNHHSFEGLFTATRCADETRSKPDPLMLQELLEVCGVLPHQAVMIGDTEYDMAMAQTIDMPTVAVSFGVHDVERLQTYKPQVCIDHIAQLLPWLKQYSPI